MDFEFKINNDLVDYAEAIDYMEQRVEEVIKNTQSPLVWFLEHESVYSAGISANDSDLITSNNFPIIKTGRGGKYTYHGPGQRVVYIIMDLQKRGAPSQADLKKYIYDLESWLINALSVIGIVGERRENRIGIWVIDKNHQEAKIAAIGVRVRKWVTYHGVAININPQMQYFNNIIPCGIKDYGVTSFENLGIKTSIKEFDKILQDEFIKIFS